MRDGKVDIWANGSFVAGDSTKISQELPENIRNKEVGDIKRTLTSQAHGNKGFWSNRDLSHSYNYY